MIMEAAVFAMSNIITMQLKYILVKDAQVTIVDFQSEYVIYCELKLKTHTISIHNCCRILCENVKKTHKSIHLVLIRDPLNGSASTLCTFYIKMSIALHCIVLLIKYVMNDIISL